MSYDMTNFRNVALIGHGNTGKTTLTEAMLYHIGAITRQGKISDGSTVGDYDPEEIRKGITMNTSIIPLSLKKVKINILDTPGFADFLGEVYRALKVVESTICLVDAQAGVEVDTELFWDIAKKFELPAAFFINKLDKENIAFENAVESIKNTLTPNAVPIHLPIGRSETFEGIVDLLSGKAHFYKKGGNGTSEIKDVPDDMKDEVEEAKSKLMEAAAECDETLLDKYFEKGTLTEEDVIKGIRKGIKEGMIFPIFCGSGECNIGTDLLISAMENYLPSPADSLKIKTEGGTIPSDSKETNLFVWKTFTEQHIGELVFIRCYTGKVNTGDNLNNSRTSSSEKIGQFFGLMGKEKKELPELIAGDIAALVKLKDTTTNDTLSSGSTIISPIEFPRSLIYTAVKPKTKADQEKVSLALRKLSKDDPTFSLQVDPELAQTIIHGMGEAHLNTMVARLKNRFGVEVEVRKPKVPYRETIKRAANTEYKHKKQTGGRGQYGHVCIEFKPFHPEGDEKFEFIDAIVGGVIPNKFIPAVEKGLVETMERGAVAGYPLINVTARLYFGSYHDVDSSEMAFKIAASQALKQALDKGNYTFLEPIYNVTIKVPDENQGDVMGDLNNRRGRIMGMEAQGRQQILKAQIPLAQMYKYINDLRSMTRGRGIFEMTFSHYEEVPHNLHQGIIDEAKAMAEDDEV